MTKKVKKSRRKKIIFWLIIDLSVAVIIFALLMYEPGRYNPLDTTSGDFDSNEVSPYLLQLTSDIINNAQLGKPFDVVITQEGFNDMISRADWPIESEGILLHSPAVLLNPDTIVLMGIAEYQSIEFIITIELEPKIDSEGLLNIKVATLKVGAVNITPLARIIAKKMYTEKLATMDDINEYDLRTKIVASLLNNESFEPIFEIEDETIQVEKITIEEGSLSGHLVTK